MEKKVKSFILSIRYAYLMQWFFKRHPVDLKFVKSIVVGFVATLNIFWWFYNEHAKTKTNKTANDWIVVLFLFFIVSNRFVIVHCVHQPIRHVNILFPCFSLKKKDDERENHIFLGYFHTFCGPDFLFLHVQIQSEQSSQLVRFELYRKMRMVCYANEACGYLKRMQNERKRERKSY